jgi:hypothetical protein
MGYGLTLNVLTPRSIAQRSFAVALMELIQEVCPDVFPQKYNNFEPINKVVLPGRTDEMLDAWAGTFFWKRKRPPVSGSAFLGNPRAHDNLKIDGVFSSMHIAPLIRSWQRLSIHCAADFALLHWLTPHEREQVPYDMWTSFDRILTTFDLRKNIPNLPWATIFGTPYIEMFGRDRLLASPAAVVEELGADQVYVQLTPCISDLEVNFEEFQAVRRRVKEHLGNNAFMREVGARVPVKPEPSLTELQESLAARGAAGGAYRVPQFDLHTDPGQESSA